MLKAIHCIGIVMMSIFMLLPGNAMAQIAPGVQQSAAHTANITGTVTQSDGTPLAGSDVKLSGPAILTTKSDAHGVFIFTSVPWGVYAITVTSSTLGIASRSNVAVSGDINVAIQYEAQTHLQTIAHVSTHSAGASINVTQASIASVNPSDYAFQGNSSWRQLLDRIPGVTVGGGLSGGDTTAGVIPDGPLRPIILSINGALPYETAVMLDGMPLESESYEESAPGGGVDLGVLPLNGFDSAEVVRGPGANSPSIVDSIGGSFVLHAPGSVSTNHFQFSASNDPYGGIVSNVKAALRFGRLSATLIYGVNDSPGPFGTQNVIPAYSEAPATVNGQIFQGCGPSGCVQFPPNPKYQSFGIPGECFCELQEGLLYCCVPLSTAWSQHNGALALSYDITPSITTQVFYAGSSSQLNRPPFGYLVDFTPGPGYDTAGGISPGLHNYVETVGDPYTIAQASSLLEERVTAYLGGRGVLRLAALQDNSFSHYTSKNLEPDGQYTVYGSGYLGSTSPGTYTVFNGNSEELTFPSGYNAAYNWTNNRDLLASYATQIGSALNAGISYVTSYYNAPDSFFINQPFCLFSSAVPPAVSETTNEWRLHAGTAVLNKLSLDASWYFAKGMYHVQNPDNPAGTTWTDSVFSYNAPRFGAVWHASPDIAIRFTAGGGFALPPIFNLIGSNGAPIPGGTFYYTCAPNLKLKPEQSFGFDIGTDMRLHRDTVLSFDVYRTNLYGQIFQSTEFTGTYLGLPLYTTQYNNLAQSRFEGINADIRHDVSKGMYWHGSLGLTRAYVVSVPQGFYNSPVTGPNSVNTYIVPGINFDGAFQSTVPYATGSAQLGYRWSPQKYVDISPTYYGKNNTYFEPAFVEFDAHAGYPLTKSISLLANFRNITGIYGQNYEYLNPSTILAAPAIPGALPSPLFELPYGPRTVVVTVNFTY